MNEKIYQMATTLLPQMGCANTKKLIEAAGSASAVFELQPADLVSITGVDAPLSEHICQSFPNALQRAEKEWEFITNYHIQPLFYQEANFPQKLLECEDGPVMLFYKGNIDLNSARFLAIVGTRKATEYGKLMCQKIVEELSSMNIVIISGLAYGIDGTAHKAALANGLPTLGIMASGMNQIYPVAHKKLATQMISQGGIITEFFSGTFPEPYQFIRRNRIIAGMADAVLVVESAAKGGSLVTADLANSYYRDVFALPGKTNDPFSIGCNQLIKYHKAELIENAQDIAKAMNWDLQPVYKEPKDLFSELNDKEQLVIQLLIHYHKMHIDTLSEALELSVEETRTILLGLEFSSLIRCLPGDLYERV